MQNIEIIQYSKNIHEIHRLETHQIHNMGTHQIHTMGTHQIHRAGWVLVNPWQIIENGYVSVVNGTIVDVSSGKPSLFPSATTSSINSKIIEPTIIEHGRGILMPALVNAHTHFELSALKGKIPFNRGFNGWVKELLRQRELCSIDLLCQEAKKAIESAVATGTLFAGEISTLGITKDIFANSDIGGVWFQEYIGVGASYHLTDCNNSFCPSIKKISMAGHAPHTTSPELLRRVKQQTKSAHLPFSIHVAESIEETEFITQESLIITQESVNWADFLKERGIDCSGWHIPSRSPVQYLKDMGVLDSLTLMVHLLNVDIEDIQIIAKSHAKPILCPRSNFNLHNTLPNIPLFLKYGLKPALGTDSLATTETLNMFDEMAFIANRFPEINPSDIIAMATVNGAHALGLEKNIGTLEKGKIADFIYIPLDLSLNISKNNIKNIIISHNV